MFILVFMAEMQKMMCWLMAFWYGRQQGTKVQRNGWILCWIGRESCSDGMDFDMYSLRQIHAGIIDKHYEYFTSFFYVEHINVWLQFSNY